MAESSSAERMVAIRVRSRAVQAITAVRAARIREFLIRFGHVSAVWLERILTAARQSGNDRHAAKRLVISDIMTQMGVCASGTNDATMNVS